MTLGGRRSIRRPLTAATSLVAVAIAAVYLLSPTRTAFALNIHASSSVTAGQNQVVVYGDALDVRRDPMGGVQVTVTCDGQPLLSATTVGDGTFRATASLAAETACVIDVPAIVHGPGATQRQIDLSPGQAYAVTIRVNPTGKLILLPVRSY
jgi:hypothetical protein